MTSALFLNWQKTSHVASYYNVDLEIHFCNGGGVCVSLNASITLKHWTDSVEVFYQCGSLIYI